MTLYSEVDKLMQSAGISTEQRAQDLIRLWVEIRTKDPECGVACQYTATGEFKVWSSPVAPKDRVLWLAREDSVPLQPRFEEPLYQRAASDWPVPVSDPHRIRPITGA